MQEALKDAVVIANDDLTRDLISLVQRTPQSHELGGRPRMEIDINWLAHASQGWTLKDIAKELGCSTRTVRRRMLEYNLAEPAPPVIQTVVQPDGTFAREWHPTGPTGFAFRNDPTRLDELVRPILCRYQNYSLGLVKGALRTQGYRVARDRIQQSLIRVRGIQPCFVNRPIERRVYSVPEVNSLWHHDGNHSELAFMWYRDRC